MYQYIKVLRPTNLIIVFFTQFYFYFYLIYPAILKANLTPSLNIYEVLLFIGISMIVCASGYLINDFFDLEIDSINEIKRSEFNKRQLINYFNVLSLTGFVFAIYLAIQIGRAHLFVLYPVSIIILFIYSKYLKLFGFIGNILVALMCGMTTLILLLAEPKLNLLAGPQISAVVLSIWAFSIFAFLINLIREIVKDMEDIKGDKLAGSVSLPIKLGVNKTKVLLYFYKLFLVLTILIWTFSVEKINTFEIVMFNLIFLVAPLLLSLLRLKKAVQKSHFTYLSRFYKFIMMAGLIGVILISNQLK